MVVATNRSVSIPIFATVTQSLNCQRAESRTQRRARDRSIGSNANGRERTSVGDLRDSFCDGSEEPSVLEISRKEVIQPQVPLRLPCYDFAPVTELTFGGCLLAVSPPTLGPPSFHGVTGGVYKARERIHRGVADPRLLAIPASCGRVADHNPNLDRLFPISSPSQACNGLYRPL